MSDAGGSSAYGEAAAGDGVLEAVRATAFARLTRHEAATTNLALVPEIYPSGRRLSLVDSEIVVPEDSILVFQDLQPGANFAHPCRYLFHSPEDGRLLHAEPASFPPEVADPQIAVEEFHAPLVRPRPRPNVYDPLRWTQLPDYPWLQDDNRFALLFTSEISNRRHLEDLEFAYRILRHKYGFSPGNIYALCFDGTIGAVDADASQMATWVGDGSAYEMAPDGAASVANLESALTGLSERMDAESLLFVHTNNHGSETGLCVDNSTVVTPAEWASMLDGMDPFGTLVVTMEQCFSGAFLQTTLDHSRASRTSFASAVPADKVSAGDTHFDPWAQAWLEAMAGATAFGGALPHQPDGDGNSRISVREAFDYSKAHDTAAIDDPQYGDKPVGCGSSIYLSKPPKLSEILELVVHRYAEIERLVFKRPIPDPPPEWGPEMLASLATAEALARRLEAIAPE